MSGDILELKAMMASTSSLPSPTPSIRTTSHIHENNGVTVELQDETNQQQQKNNHISVANILSRPTPSPCRQTSASTFLCPENIPGRVVHSGGKWPPNVPKLKYLYWFSRLLSRSNVEKWDYKIRRGPKLEGYAFANFGYSSETDGESHHEMAN